MLDGITKMKRKKKKKKHPACLPSWAVKVSLSLLLSSSVTKPGNTFDLCKVPFLVAQRTNTSSLLPALNAVEMEDVTTTTKSNGQAVFGSRAWVRLVLDGWLVERVATDGACVSVNIPRPQSYRVPFFDFKVGNDLSGQRLGCYFCWDGRCRGVCHVNVDSSCGHCVVVRLGLEWCCVYGLSCYPQKNYEQSQPNNVFAGDPVGEFTYKL